MNESQPPCTPLVFCPQRQRLDGRLGAQEHVLYVNSGTADLNAGAPHAASTSLRGVCGQRDTWRGGPWRGGPWRGWRAAHCAGVVRVVALPHGPRRALLAPPRVTRLSAILTSLDFGAGPVGTHGTEDAAGSGGGGLLRCGRSRRRAAAPPRAVLAVAGASRGALCRAWEWLDLLTISRLFVLIVFSAAGHGGMHGHQRSGLLRGLGHPLHVYVAAGGGNKRRNEENSWRHTFVLLAPFFFWLYCRFFFLFLISFFFFLSFFLVLVVRQHTASV